MPYGIDYTCELVVISPREVDAVTKVSLMQKHYYAHRHNVLHARRAQKVVTTDHAYFPTTNYNIRQTSRPVWAYCGKTLTTVCFGPTLVMNRLVPGLYRSNPHEPDAANTRYVHQTPA